MKFRLSLLTVALVALGAAACGEEEHGAEACAAVAATPKALTASATVAMATAITPSETPYQIALPGGARGYVKLTIAGDTALLAAFRSTGVLSGVTKDGAAVLLAAAAALDGCPSDITAHHDLDLETAGDYVFALGPVVGDSAWMYLAEEEHAHED